MRIIVWLARVLGTLGYAVAGARRRITLTNLSLCFPELSEAERILRAQLGTEFNTHAEQIQTLWGKSQEVET